MEQTMPNNSQNEPLSFPAGTEISTHSFISGYSGSGKSRIFQNVVKNYQSEGWQTIHFAKIGFQKETDISPELKNLRVTDQKTLFQTDTTELEKSNWMVEVQEVKHREDSFSKKLTELIFKRNKNLLIVIEELDQLVKDAADVEEFSMVLAQARSRKALVMYSFSRPLRYDLKELLLKNTSTIINSEKGH